jgi:hypothetical protein
MIFECRATKVSRTLYKCGVKISTSNNTILKPNAYRTFQSSYIGPTSSFILQPSGSTKLSVVLGKPQFCTVFIANALFLEVAGFFEADAFLEGRLQAHPQAHHMLKGQSGQWSTLQTLWLFPGNSLASWSS